ncbi:type III secretion pathway outer membrane protein [Oleiphilus messinensis]|uniref:Type 3 secretion system secretin n=2 Tax=Oleiphilus messinensis TaxID=141451 RepID=A0A1Y0IFZ8_9GAMM|nr:type III secretion pathway outer membrane protein [Oleiphilus messinensis]
MDNHLSARGLRIEVLIVLVVLTLYMTFTSSTVKARDIPLPDGTEVNYMLNGETLEVFLKRFFYENGLRLVLSEPIKSDRRTLNGPRNGSPKRIFNRIVESNGLVPYYDGNSAYLYTVDELSHRYFSFPDDRVVALRRALSRSQLQDRNNAIVVDRASGLVEISGVPRFVDQMLRMVQAIAYQGDAPTTVFRYIPLKYAWATDRSFSAGGRNVTIPGVASILRQVIHGPTQTGYSGDVIDIAEPAKAESLKGKGLAALSGDTGSRQLVLSSGKVIDLTDTGSVAPGHTKGASNAVPILEGSEGSRIVADAYNNAIIIRDAPDRIPMYEDLIRTLDVSSPLIEIEAAIIDVNQDKLRKLGVDWRFAEDDIEVSLFNSQDSNSDTKGNFLQALAAGNVAPLDGVAGLGIGAIVGNKDQFIARLNLLQREGVISVSSRPKVATLNDLEAVIESSESLYVPVQGAFETDLFKVFSGTILRVTPHVIRDDIDTQIRLIITVEDGAINMTQDASGDSVPATTRNAVLTQAIVNEGHSLLLGGLVRETSQVATQKIPLLGDIPWLGSLFKTESKIQGSSERLFLISPRILPAGQTRQTTTESTQNGREKVIATCRTNCREEYGREQLNMF